MLQPGSTLRRGYTIQRVIGQGGMGTVYLARHTKLKAKRVAIKEMVARIDDPDALHLAVTQFEKEAEILSSIEHPGIVDVKDYFEEDGIHYLVEDFIHGVTLASIIEQVPHLLPIYEVLDWMDQLCDVLEYLHTYNPPIIVRDLKPDNIMLDAKGMIHLIDFGIARVFDPGSKTENILKGTGTIGYAPVEQYGGGTTDTRSDVYALGATLYACLATRVPPWSVDIATGEEELTPPSAYNPYISQELEKVILKMMAIRKDDRYQTAREVRAALREVRGTVENGPAITVVVSQRFCTSCGATTVPRHDSCPACGEGYEEIISGVPVRFPEVDPKSGLPREAGAAVAAEPAPTPVATSSAAAMAAAAARALSSPGEGETVDAHSMAAAAAAALSGSMEDGAPPPPSPSSSSASMAKAAAAAMSALQEEEEAPSPVAPTRAAPVEEEEPSESLMADSPPPPSREQPQATKAPVNQLIMVGVAAVIMIGGAWKMGVFGGRVQPTPTPTAVVHSATPTTPASPTAVPASGSPGASASPGTSATPASPLAGTGSPGASTSPIVASGSPTGGATPQPSGTGVVPSATASVAKFSLADDTAETRATLHSRRLTADDLTSLDAHQVAILYYTIYALHGQTFPEEDVQEYFNGRIWYTRNPDKVTDAMLNDTEKFNVEFIQSYQKEHGLPHW